MMTRVLSSRVIHLHQSAVGATDRADIRSVHQFHYPHTVHGALTRRWLRGPANAPLATEVRWWRTQLAPSLYARTCSRSSPIFASAFWASALNCCTVARL